MNSLINKELYYRINKNLLEIIQKSYFIDQKKLIEINICYFKNRTVLIISQDNYYKKVSRDIQIKKKLHKRMIFLILIFLSI